MFRDACSLCQGDHDEGACQSQRQPATAKAKGKGKGKKGKGDVPDEVQQSVVAFSYIDFVDIDWVKQVGAMPFSQYVDCRFAEHREVADAEFVEGNIPRHSVTLRNVCYQLVQRYEHAGQQGLQSWFKDDRLPAMVNIAGRLWGGIKAADMTDAEKAKFETLKRVQVGYDTTRPGFTYRKDVKELIRGRSMTLM